MSKVFIIAEAGVNHNGSIEIAKQLVDVACKAHADAIKFQTFKGEKLVSKYAQKAEYQKQVTDQAETQLEMIKRLELSEQQHIELMDYCKERGILFLSTPFDLDSIEFLSSLGMTCFKIPSGEITNLPYLRKIAKVGKKFIVSTGMSTLQEVRDCVSVLKNEGVKELTLLHCNTEYPTPMTDVNLKAMLTLKEEFNVEIGYSDHTLGIEVPIAAVALGAQVIEKHITLDKQMEGPDHSASIEPDELIAMVKAIRNIEKALGQGIKQPSASEMKNMKVARKSIVAAKKIQKGEILDEQNLTVKRPGNGISPMKWDEVIGRVATRDYEEDELIENE